MAGGKRLQQSRDLYEWIQAVICSVLTVVLVFTFAVRVMRVDGPSMRETLQDGDLLVVVNRLLSGEPESGEIVIVRKESFENGDPIVKRVIATEGQTVDIDFETGAVTVDGTVTVPEGSVFVMGDNRNDSRDSRDPELGAVDVRCVIGRAVWLAVPGKTANTERRELSRIGTLT